MCSRVAQLVKSKILSRIRVEPSESGWRWFKSSHGEYISERREAEFPVSLRLIKETNFHNQTERKLSGLEFGDAWESPSPDRELGYNRARWVITPPVFIYGVFYD